MQSEDGLLAVFFLVHIISHSQTTMQRENTLVVSKWLDLQNVPRYCIVVHGLKFPPAMLRTRLHRLWQSHCRQVALPRHLHRLLAQASDAALRSRSGWQASQRFVNACL